MHRITWYAFPSVQLRKGMEQHICAASHALEQHQVDPNCNCITNDRLTAMCHTIWLHSYLAVPSSVVASKAFLRFDMLSTCRAVHRYKDGSTHAGTHTASSVCGQLHILWQQLELPSQKCGICRSCSCFTESWCKCLHHKPQGKHMFKLCNHTLPCMQADGLGSRSSNVCAWQPACMRICLRRQNLLCILAVCLALLLSCITLSRDGLLDACRQIMQAAIFLQTCPTILWASLTRLYGTM